MLTSGYDASMENMLRGMETTEHNRTTDSFADVNGARLYVRTTNNFPLRPTLVFLHDSLGCVELWRDFPRRLGQATHCNLFLYDRQGYGKSDPLPSPARAADYLDTEARVLGSLLQRFQITEPILFGHSNGATIALIAASRYPARIKGVISEAGHVYVEPITLNGIERALVDYRDTDLKRRLAKYHGTRVETIFRSWTETWLSEAFTKWNIEHLLPLIQCPVLVVQGDEDEFGTLNQVESITTRIQAPTHQVILPGVGHTPHKELPDATLQAAAKFVRKLTSP